MTAIHQLSCLKHLRSLEANNCAIADIDGIHDLDGLVHVSLSGNRLRTLRFETVSWRRLETINVSDNTIKEVTGIDMLPVLKVLNLGKLDPVIYFQSLTDSRLCLRS